jgi:lipopolysaccharide biosynthesis glycosyltransferase
LSGLIRPQLHFETLSLGPRPAKAGKVVAIAFDGNYAFYGSVLTLSMFLCSMGRDFDVVILCDGLDETDVRRLRRIADAFYRSVTLVSVPRDLYPSFKSVGRWSRATHFRVLAAEIIEAKIVTYIDADCLVLTDIGELFAEYSSGGLVGAVIDHQGSNRERTHHKLGIGDDPYINAGVMIIDAERWKTEDILQQYISFLDANHRDLALPDQDALNVILSDRKYTIDAKWNTLIHERGVMRLRETLKREGIWHFTLNQPWKRWAHPWLRDQYQSFAEVIGPLPESYWQEPETVREWILTAYAAEVDGDAAKAAAIHKRLAHALAAREKSLLSKKVASKAEVSRDGDITIQAHK